jgi:hypothetical protein
VPARVVLDFRGVSPVWGGKPVQADGTEIEVDPTKSFASAHYEQHMAVTGTIAVGDEEITLDGLGLRDKSWGPRYWQAIAWYRWLPMVFGEDFAMMLTVQGRGEDGRDRRSAGMVCATARTTR